MVGRRDCNIGQTAIDKNINDETSARKLRVQNYGEKKRSKPGEKKESGDRKRDLLLLLKGSKS